MTDALDRTALVVLAGGSGTRLGGVRKPDLRIDGKRLMDRVVERAGAVGTVLVCAGRDTATLKPRHPDDLILADAPGPARGPLAGLAAAVDWIKDHRPEITTAITVAVDTPFLPTGYCARLLCALPQNHMAACCGYRGATYPTNAIWRIEALCEIDTLLESGAGPRHLLERCQAPTLDCWDEQPEDPFANINTLPDLLRAQRSAAGEPGPRKSHSGLGKANQLR